MLSNGTVSESVPYELLKAGLNCFTLVANSTEYAVTALKNVTENVTSEVVSAVYNDVTNATENVTSLVTTPVTTLMNVTTTMYNNITGLFCVFAFNPDQDPAVSGDPAILPKEAYDAVAAFKGVWLNFTESAAAVVKTNAKLCETEDESLQVLSSLNASLTKVAKDAGGFFADVTNDLCLQLNAQKGAPEKWTTGQTVALGVAVFIGTCALAYCCASPKRQRQTSDCLGKMTCGVFGNSDRRTAPSFDELDPMVSHSDAPHSEALHASRP